MTPLRARRVAAVLAALIGLLFTVVGIHSFSWIGATFPGFFVMANRVVPSISVPAWDEGDLSQLFQTEVLSVDSVPVATATEVYARVRALSPGTKVVYEVRNAAGEQRTVEVAARRFSFSDYVLILGGLSLNGLVFVVISLIVLVLKPSRTATFGLLAACLATGVFAITAVDLYGPYWFFRLHVLAETIMSAAFIHLALVFPTDHLAGRRTRALVAVYLPFCLLAVGYESVLYNPSAYTTAHLIATALHGVAVVAMIVSAAAHLIGAASPLARRRAGVVMMGILGGLAVPGLLMAFSAVVGGKVPINAGVFTAFVFPLSLAYSIVKQDLFEIDTMLRRAMTYMTVVAIVTGAYLGLLFAVGLFAPSNGAVALSPAAYAMLNLGLVLLIPPARSRVQQAIDHVFFRRSYDPEIVLSALSQALALTRTREGVVQSTAEVLQQTFGLSSAALFLRTGQRRFREAGGGGENREIELSASLARRFRSSAAVLTRDAWEDSRGFRAANLEAEIVVSVCSGSRLVALIVLGRKHSGNAFTMHDAALLRTLANQVALALRTAQAFKQLEGLNTNLEKQVRQRTVELEAANGEANRSVAELQRAYERLERNQASLMRADRLATLGRLTAGIAHEINTPLGAILNSMKVLGDLGNEYLESIEDPTVLANDHREIGQEIVATSRCAAEWASKAALFIRKVKMHGRDARSEGNVEFSLQAVVDETAALLAHRVRATGCEIDYLAPQGDLRLVGDPSLLGQVLINLVTNAIDAYEETPAGAGTVEIRSFRMGEQIGLTIRDSAGGIPAAVLPQIFDELYTTKEPGRGTGLGLWIARNLVEQGFSGTLTAASTEGAGSTFTAMLGSAPASATVDPPASPTLHS